MHALDVLTLPQVLALYIKTRNYDRELRAREYENSIRFLQSLAAVNSGEKASQVTRELFSSFLSELDHWRHPETPKKGWRLTAKQREFLHFSAIREDEEDD